MKAFNPFSTKGGGGGGGVGVKGVLLVLLQTFLHYSETNKASIQQHLY